MSARPFAVLCYGDPVADIVIRVAQPPAPGGKVLGQARGVWAGGTTANAACAVAQLGLRAAVFGRVGDDHHAALLLDSFEELGVSRAFMSAGQGCASASTVTMIADGGDKALVYVPMAPAAPSRDRLMDALLQSQLLYAMPYDLDELRMLAGLARKCGTLVAIDLEAAVAPDPASMRSRAGCADIVFFNEGGFIAGTGERPTPQALAGVLALGPRLVVVSLGAAGAIAASADGCWTQAAYTARVVDTTGAGDCFNGAFLAAILEGQPVPQALAQACCAASFAVEALGARSGLPQAAMVAQRMGEQK
jgi:sugar/nucleoside kinase (ribokinase family)